MKVIYERAQWLSLALGIVFVADALCMASGVVSLRVGYYDSTCPRAEKIVRRTVMKAVSEDNGLAAAIIRMHFHDCFVRGCDASVLLDSNPAGGRVEKKSRANNPSLRGFEVIDAAKSKLESRCPDTVSCSDIVAFAARDSAFLAGGIRYSVPAGRRDGLVSNESEVIQNLPLPFFNSKQLASNFAKKGLAVDDMVVLSGSHSIGVTHCSSFDSRLYNFNSTHPQDPSMNSDLAGFLKSRCPSPTAKAAAGDKLADPIVPLDIGAPHSLDVKYYKNLINRKGLLTSDQTLVSDRSTAAMVAEHARKPVEWRRKFAAAMVRMGSIEVLTGGQGEIRKNCRIVNS